MDLQPQQTTTWIDKDNDYGNHFTAFNTDNGSSSSRVLPGNNGREYELHVIELQAPTDHSTVVHQEIQLEEGEDNTTTSSSTTTSNTTESLLRRRREPRNSTPLIEWLETHQSNPYPTKTEKQQLARLSKLTVRQLNDWFANARRNIKRHGYSEWRKKKSVTGIGFTKYRDPDKNSPNLIVGSLELQSSQQPLPDPHHHGRGESEGRGVINYLPHYTTSPTAAVTTTTPIYSPHPTVVSKIPSHSTVTDSCSPQPTYQFFTMPSYNGATKATTIQPLTTAYHPHPMLPHSLYQYPAAALITEGSPTNNWSDYTSNSGTSANKTPSQQHIINYYHPSIWPPPPPTTHPLVHYGAADTRSSLPIDSWVSPHTVLGSHGDSTDSTGSSNGSTGGGTGTVYFEGSMIKTTPTP